jgi:hypothetical protein
VRDDEQKGDEEVGELCPESVKRFEIKKRRKHEIMREPFTLNGPRLSVTARAPRLKLQPFGTYVRLSNKLLMNIRARSLGCERRA